MSEPPEFWAFLVSNFLLLVIGGGLTVLSVAAYRRSKQDSFGVASLGFGVLTAGTLIEALYEFVIRGTYELAGREMLAIQSVEGVLIATGLGLLFYSLKRHQ